jgi:effector-binding domain-containing protein
MEPTKTYEIREVTRREQPTAVTDTTLSAEQIGPWLATSYRAVAGVLGAQGTHPDGPPFARYHPIGQGRFAVEAGFPVSAAIDDTGDVHPSVLPGGPAASTVHVGPYRELESAYAALESWVRERGAEPAGDAWEVYLSDPAARLDPATWRTEIVQPYRPAPPPAAH